MKYQTEFNHSTRFGIKQADFQLFGQLLFLRTPLITIFLLLFSLLGRRREVGLGFLIFILGGGLGIDVEKQTIILFICIATISFLMAQFQVEVDIRITNFKWKHSRSAIRLTSQVIFLNEFAMNLTFVHFEA